jgi:hypothetical protein
MDGLSSVSLGGGNTMSDGKKEELKEEVETETKITIETETEIEKEK